MDGCMVVELRYYLRCLLYQWREECCCIPLQKKIFEKSYRSEISCHMAPDSSLNLTIINISTISSLLPNPLTPQSPQSPQPPHPSLGAIPHSPTPT